MSAAVPVAMRGCFGSLWEIGADTIVVPCMADLVIDRALNGTPQQMWPQWAQMLGIAAATAV